MKILLLTFCALFIHNSLQAMTWQELQAEIDSVESGQPGNQQVIMRFSEMIQMLATYTQTVYESHPDAKITCPPLGVSMHIDEIVSMVRKQARDTKAEKSASVQVLMLDAFKLSFPCE